MSFSRYLFSLMEVCKEVVRIYNRLWVKTLRLNVLALNALILNSCASTYISTPYYIYMFIVKEVLFGVRLFKPHDMTNNSRYCHSIFIIKDIYVYICIWEVKSYFWKSFHCILSSLYPITLYKKVNISLRFVFTFICTLIIESRIHIHVCIYENV